MKVEKLIRLLQQMDPKDEIFVSCQGYNNYSHNRQSYKEDDGTWLLKADGKLFLADSCNIELYE